MTTDKSRNIILTHHSSMAQQVLVPCNHLLPRQHCIFLLLNCQNTPLKTDTTLRRSEHLLHRELSRTSKLDAAVGERAKRKGLPQNNLRLENHDSASRYRSHPRACYVTASLEVGWCVGGVLPVFTVLGGRERQTIVKSSS